MLPRKNFKNLRTVMAVLTVLNNFQDKFVIFLSPHCECFTKYDAFCSHSFDYASFRRLRHIVMKRFEIRKNCYSSTALLKMAGGGMHPQHPPLDPLLVPTDSQKF